MQEIGMATLAGVVWGIVQCVKGPARMAGLLLVLLSLSVGEAVSVSAFVGGLHRWPETAPLFPPGSWGQTLGYGALLGLLAVGYHAGGKQVGKALGSESTTVEPTPPAERDEASRDAGNAPA